MVIGNVKPIINNGFYFEKKKQTCIQITFLLVIYLKIKKIPFF